jgi:outer membrane protein OmpA-like peptidoglycan-associated protein
MAQRVPCDKIKPLKILAEEPIASMPNVQQYFYFDVDTSFYDMRFVVDSACHIEYDLYEYAAYCSTKDSVVPKAGITTYDKVLSTEEILNGQCFCEACSKQHRIQLAHNKRYVVAIKSDCDSILVDTRITDDILALAKESKLKWYQKKYKKGDKLVLNNILFQANSTALLSRSKSELNSLAYLLQNNPTIKIEIDGHVNAPGETNTDANLKLSEGRAKAIYDFLIKNGVDAARLSYKGYGNTKMIFPNAKTEMEMKVNRRVEILIL